MPWIETDAMQQRVLFIKAWLSRRYKKTELCKQFNISRPTADKWIERHERVGFEAQQAFFDRFLQEYNEERSHEGIGRKTPAECYQPSMRTYTGKIEPYDYGDNVDVRKVKLSGEVKWQGKTYYLSQVLASEPIAFEPYADGIWHIYYRFHFLGIFDAREMKIKPATQWHVQPK